MRIALFVLGLLLFPAPLLAQDVVCCNEIFRVDGDWFGMLRDCKRGMEHATPQKREDICVALIASGLFCEDVVPYCDCEALLAEAKAEYDRLLAAARAIDAAADEMIAGQEKAYEDALKVVKDQLYEEFVTNFSPNTAAMHAGLVEDPADPAAHARAVAENPADYYAKVFEDIENATKEMPPPNSGGWKLFGVAAKWAQFLDFTVDWIAVDAKVIVKAQEIDRFGNQAKENIDAATDTVRKARLSWKRYSRLMEVCRNGNPKALPGANLPPDEPAILTGEAEFNERWRLVRAAGEKGEKASREMQRAEDDMEEAKTYAERWLGDKRPAESGHETADTPAARADWKRAKAKVGSSFEKRARAMRLLGEAGAAIRKAREKSDSLKAPKPSPAPTPATSSPRKAK